MAINNSAINTVYNYFLTSYAPKTDTKFDAHKKSELRGVYNSIVKMNSEAPLFIVDKSQETKQYAVGLKENARSFRNTIASLGGLEDGELLNKKAAATSNEDIVTAVYIGDNSETEALEFDMEVKSLATGQVNLGKMLPSDKAALSENTYSFDIGINGLNYEFQYNVSEGDTNRVIQDRLARLISNADIGLKASVSGDGQGNSALVIESERTGAPLNGRIFTISDNNTSKTSGTVSFLGIDNVAVEPSNSVFLINGNEREAQENSFTVEKRYEITIKRVNREDEGPVRVGLKPDLESMISNVNKLLGGYNSFVETADHYSENHPKSGRLVREMQSLATVFKDELEGVGVEIDENGRLSLNEQKLKETAMTLESPDEDLASRLEGFKKFAGAVLRKSNQVSLNPMQYADKTIVAYKNPGHNYATPYVTSAYSGMMFNSYC